MVLTPLVALLALQGVPTDGSLLAKIVGIPTGRNGYEDYLRACDLAGPDIWPMYEQWMGYKASLARAVPADPDVETTLPPLPPGVSVDSTDLGIKRAANDRVGAAFDILVLGNDKNVYDPRQDFNIETTFPELARFKMLSKIGSNKAYVEFSEGKTSQAVRDLLDGLRFSRNVFNSVQISSLVSIAMQAIFLAEFNRHLGQLSLNDAQTIDKTCQGLIETPYPVIDMMKRECTMTLNSIDKVIADPKLLLSEEEDKLYGAALKGLGGTERQQLKDFVSQALEQRYSDFATKLSRAESLWPVGDTSIDPPTSAADKSVSNLAVVIANCLQGKDLQHNFTKAMAKARIQLRLLQLHAKVIEYHWQNSNWPTSIEQFADAKTARDPFTGDAFHYEFKDGSYRLYSTGVPGLGQIELKYRMSSMRQGSGDDHPSPAR